MNTSGRGTDRSRSREYGTVWVIAGLFFALSAGHAGDALGSCVEPPADVTGNGVTNVADVVCALTVVGWDAAGQVDAYPGCAVASPSEVDTNCDGSTDVADVVAMIPLVFGQGLPLAIDADQNDCADACEVPVDTDEDGSFDEDDCAPTDPDVFPGADEVCNGIDDDCDSATDEAADATVDASCADDFDCTIDACDAGTGTCTNVASDAECASGELCDILDPTADPTTGCVAAGPPADPFCTAADPAANFSADGDIFCEFNSLQTSDGPFGAVLPQPGLWGECPLRIVGSDSSCTTANCLPAAIQFELRFDNDKLALDSLYQFQEPFPGFSANFDVAGLGAFGLSPMSSGHLLLVAPGTGTDWNTAGGGTAFSVNLADSGAALLTATRDGAGGINGDPAWISLWFRPAGPTSDFTGAPARVCIGDVVPTASSSLVQGWGFDAALDTFVVCPVGSSVCP